MTVKLFLGLPGTGKTQAMIDFISLDLSSKTPHLFFCVDRAAEWGTHVDGVENPRWRGRKWKEGECVVAPNPDKFERWIEDEGLADSGLVLFRAPWEGIDIARYSILFGDIVYVDDEIDLVAVYEKWKENPLREIIHRGRHLPNAQGVPCKAHIMANSSFSWWTSYLGHGKVIAPKLWYADGRERTKLLTSWTRI